MAVEFVVETGTGSATATSYLSVEELKQLWENVGYSIGTTTDEQFTQFLNKATLVLDAQYGTLWPGTRDSTTQALDWPREDAEYVDGTDIEDDVIPIEVRRAVSELVYADVNGTNLQPTLDSRGTISRESVRVDVIETTTTYTEYSAQDNLRTTVVAVIDALARLVGSTESGAFPNLDIDRV